CQHGCGVPYSF
nr:immunoglobulin light chain junction region [Macaca mulatta]